MTNSSPGRNTEERFTLRHNARGERPRKSKTSDGDFFRVRKMKGIAIEILKCEKGDEYE